MLLLLLLLLVVVVVLVVVVAIVVLLSSSLFHYYGLKASFLPYGLTSKLAIAGFDYSQNDDCIVQGDGKVTMKRLLPAFSLEIGEVHSGCPIGVEQLKQLLGAVGLLRRFTLKCWLSFSIRDVSFVGCPGNVNINFCSSFSPTNSSTIGQACRRL